MQPRQPITATCSTCGRKRWLLRLRGAWKGQVKELAGPLNGPILQLARLPDGRYTTDGFRCCFCRSE